MAEKLVLVVLDGVGIAPLSEDNAFSQADTPTLDSLFTTFPYTELAAAGEAVGLPEGYIGNSEVGHLHIGAGRVVPQDLVRINEAITDGSFFERPPVEDVLSHVEEQESIIHLVGMASDGGVHSHIDHMLTLIDFFGEHDADVVTHAVLDGRDVPPESAEQYLDLVQETSKAAGTGRIGSFVGRFYAMDRDDNWERTQEAYELLVSGAKRNANTVSDGLEIARKHDRNDYFVRPTVIRGDYASVGDDDAIIFTNYREDRARQLTAAFVEPGFDRFPVHHPESVRFVSMKPYKDTFPNPAIMARQRVQPTLGEIVSEHGLQQLRLSESQKAAHVTYFFDGQREDAFDGMDTHIIPSAKVGSYDEKPEMEADVITEHAVQAFQDGKYGFVLVNYPNGDLVGHTGDVDAAVTAVETVDRCVARLVQTAQEQGYTVAITADHGNCENMKADGRMHTAHTLNNVPFCIVGDEELALDTGSHGLSRVAPTVLDLLNIEPADDMEPSLIT